MADPRKQDMVTPMGTSTNSARETRRAAASNAPRQAMDDVKEQASSLLDEARSEGKHVLEQQKDAASDQVGTVASALRSAADDLHQQRDERAGRFVSYAAERLESFGRTVRSKDIDGLIDDAERLGRRSPAAFFAGSVALGFLLSRFLKSSTRASERHESTPAEQERFAGYAARTEVTGVPPEGQAFEPTAPFASGPAEITTPTAEVTR